MSAQFQAKSQRTQRYIQQLIKGLSQSKLVIVLLLSAVLLSCQNRVKEHGPLSFEEKLDSIFVESIDFSGVALLAEKGKVIYHKAYGYRNFETSEAMDTTSIFELASVSKQFTAMTLIILKEEGKLSYDDPIDKYIPGLPYQGITIRHLLTHTSGLPDYQGVMDQYWDKTKVAGNSDNIEYLIKYKPAKLFAPGEKYEYSNTGYMLLASITEKVSGMDFISFCRERIFSPLKMTSTNIRTRDEKISLPNMAWGYIWVQDKQRYIRADSFPAFNYTIWLGNRKGPGRVSSTTSDLLTWDQALYQELVVKNETLKEAFTPTTLTNGLPSYYGFGWQLQTDPVLGNVVRHSGDNPGYKTHIIRYIDHNKTVILLSNNGHRQFEEMLNGIETILKKTPAS